MRRSEDSTEDDSPEKSRVGEERRRRRLNDVHPAAGEAAVVGRPRGGRVNLTFAAHIIVVGSRAHSIPSFSHQRPRLLLAF